MRESKDFLPLHSPYDSRLKGREIERDFPEGSREKRTELPEIISHKSSKIILQESLQRRETSLTFAFAFGKEEMSQLSSSGFNGIVRNTAKEKE